MTENTRTSAKLPHPGPYIARVTNNSDTTYMGKLEVVLEQGTFNNPELKNRTFGLSYMSPFAGATSVQHEGNSPNKFDDVQKSYGMWMVPPDLGSRVICMFIESDTQQGFWFGCIQDRWQNHMVPGIASSSKVAWGPGQKEKYGVLEIPVAEFLTKGGKERTVSPQNELKPVHPFADRLLKQGLLVDKIRGVTSSSARREIPSAVFGISTPGPLDPNGPKKIIGYKDNKSSKPVPVSRTAGHTFVMDDGDINGSNQLVRIRSASGHQILLNDSANIIYIANANGTAWIEMTATGQIDIYAADSISMHTEQDFNVRSDGNINLEAMGSVNIKSVKDTAINVGENYNLRVAKNGRVYMDGNAEQFVRGSSSYTSLGTLNLFSQSKTNVAAGSEINLKTSGALNIAASAKMRSGVSGDTASVATEALKETTIIKQQAFPKTSVNAGWGAKYQDGSVYSITSRVPMHEPWVVSDRAGWAGGPTPTPHAAADPCKPPPAKKETAAPTTSWWTDDEFINAVQNVSAKYKIDDWRDLLAVMYFETARTMNPAKRNSNSGAVGLIQFVEKTARSLGTTTDKLETLSRYDQMAWVDKYFSRSVLASAKSPVGLNDLYMSVFYPVGFDKPDDYVLIAAKEIGVDGQGRPKYQLEYEQNKGLDGLDGSKPDLKITKGEACASLATYKADVIKKLN